MNKILILTAAASTLVLSAAAQMQNGDQNVMEPLVAGGLVDGGLVDGQEAMEIDPDMMDRTPDYMPDTQDLEVEGEGEPATKLVSDDKIHMHGVETSEEEGALPQPVDGKKDASPKIMPDK